MSPTLESRPARARVMLSLLALLAAPTVAAAQTVPANGRYPVEVTAATTTVRNDAAGTALGTIAKGQRFVVSAEKAGALRISWQGRDGWIPSAEAKRVLADAREVVPATLVVRSGPTAQDPALATVKAGQAYVALEARSGWTRLQLDARSGWAATGDLRTIALGTSAGVTPGAAATVPASAAALLAERVGFGAKATGGDPNRVYHVTTLADSGPGSLRAGLETADPNWIVFDVNGTIKLAKALRPLSNKTIDGRRKKVTISGACLAIKEATNIIVADLTFTNPAGDAIEIRGAGGADPAKFTSRNFWFHHLELHSSGDGLIDVRGGTDITISWCHFHTHLKACLLSYDMNGAPTPGMRLTVHHNYFERVTRRGVELSYGMADYFNNFQYRWYEYGCGSFYGARLLSEANIYEARPGWISFERDPNPGGDKDLIVSKKALIDDWDNRPLGFIRSVADVALNGAKLVTNQPGKVFDRKTFYGATIEKPDSKLRDRIVNEAGPR